MAAAACVDCGGQISRLRKWFAGARCSECAAQRRRERDSARSEYEHLLAKLASGEADLDQAAKRLKGLAPAAELNDERQTRLRDQAFRGYADTALADDVLTEAEERRFAETGALLGIEQADLETRHRDVLERLVVARVNDGRMPEISEPSLLSGRGEVVHGETVAQLLKEVTVRERIGGGYQGVSVPLGRGFRYHVGGARGRTEARRELQAVDAGMLSVTSKRVVFTGNGGTTLEMPYSRLLKLQVYEDAVQFFLSGRKSAPLLKTDQVDAMAAMVGAAAERSRD